MKFACEVKGFVPEDRLDKREADGSTVLPNSLWSPLLMLEDSGLDLDAINKDRVGVIWGSGTRWIEYP